MEKSQNVGSIPTRAAELIAQMNRHPRFLSLLGILPNQFRTLLKETCHENREEAILDLSRSLFFAGFRLWTQRQKMASRFWKDIAPENRMINHAKRKKRKRKIEDITLSHQTARTLFTFYADIETSQINAIPDVPVPSLQIQSECQINE